MDSTSIHFLANLAALTVGVFIMAGLLLAPGLYALITAIGSWTTVVRRAVPGGRQWRQRNVPVRRGLR